VLLSWLLAFSIAFAQSSTVLYNNSTETPLDNGETFTGSASNRLESEIFGGLVFTEKSDIILRVTSTSTNDSSVTGGYDLVVVDD
jgi:hypothetical protein